MTAARDDYEDDRPAAEVVPFRPTAPGPVDAEVVSIEDEEYDEDLDDELEDTRPPSRARELVVSLTDRPRATRRQMVASTRWWVRQGMRAVPWIPVLVLREILPILRGIGRTAAAWARWVHCAELAEAIKEAKENERSKAAERLTRRRTGRAYGSAVVFLILTGVGVWAFFAYPLVLALVGVALILIFDVIGRQGREKPAPVVPFAMPSVLQKGVPLSQITASILATFEREGFEEGSVSVAAPLTWDPARTEYRIKVKTADHIKPEHVRAIERAVGAKDFAIRNLATGTSSVRELVIRVGDPLANTPPPEFLESSSRSIAQPVDLGGSAGDTPFEVTFAGVHAAIVGATGSGKTKGMIWTIIDRLSACRDCVIWGCDLAQGPALPMWRGVIQRRALTAEQADELLTAAIAEIDRRMGVLTALAEDDDPTNDADEWHAGLGPALVIVFDEFALAADYDGKSGKLDLLGKVEQIIRTGRKVWISLILGTQKTGNSDFGSSVMATQLGIKILLACSERDTVTLFGTEKRDQGWAPHLLAPSVEGDVRDAGKCYVESPAHRTPDIYRTYAPLKPAEVKRRARQRIADGLPSLDGRRAAALDAVEVPPIVAGVSRAFDSCDADRLATTELISYLDSEGLVVTDQQISDAMQIDGERIGDRWRSAPGEKQTRGYTRAAVLRKMRSLG